MRAREIVRSSRRVLVALAAADVSPSVDVIAKAGNLLRWNRRFVVGNRWPLSACVYPVEAEMGATYYPTIVFTSRGLIDLEASHCTCEAGHAGIMCHHLLAALVHAEHLGHRMED